MRVEGNLTRRKIRHREALANLSRRSEMVLLRAPVPMPAPGPRPGCLQGREAAEGLTESGRRRPEPSEGPVSHGGPTLGKMPPLVIRDIQSGSYVTPLQRLMAGDELSASLLHRRSVSCTRLPENYSGCHCRVWSTIHWGIGAAGTPRKRYVSAEPFPVIVCPPRLVSPDAWTPGTSPNMPIAVVFLCTSSPTKMLLDSWVGKVSSFLAWRFFATRLC